VNRIRTAVADLDGIADAPLADAVDRFDALCAELQTALSDLDRA
jgi:hypothetical protein